MLSIATSCGAHPHVFVDGGVSFRIGPGNLLETLEVTWRYDAFETLYILSSYGMSLNADAELSETDRRALVRLRSVWPDDFDGSAHLTIDGEPVPLEWPTDLDVGFKDGRLEVTFLRNLEEPVDLTERDVSLAFYESTYFFAFSITDAPELGPNASCSASVIPFDPEPEDQALLSVLAKLGREETTGIENVGAFFADRIEMSCVS